MMYEVYFHNGCDEYSLEEKFESYEKAEAYVEQCEQEIEEEGGWLAPDEWYEIIEVEK